MRAVVLCKTSDVDRVEDVGGVLNRDGKVNEGRGEKN
jgi:hypothetical protein